MIGQSFVGVGELISVQSLPVSSVVSYLFCAMICDRKITNLVQPIEKKATGSRILTLSRRKMRIIKRGLGHSYVGHVESYLWVSGWA